MDLIKKLLRQHLLKENWEGNQMKPVYDSEIKYNGRFHDFMIVAKDEDNEVQHYLILNVKLTPNTNHFDYSYNFSVNDINNKIKAILYTRAEAKPWLPIELKGKIMPKVLELTKDLVNKNKPKSIYRKAMEDLEGNSLKRYDYVTNLLIDLGYKLQEGYPKKDPMNRWEWLFIAGDTKLSLDEVTMFKNDIVDPDMRRKRLEKDMHESWNMFLKNGGTLK